MLHEELMIAISELKDAKNYLENVRREFENEPELLKFYEPSASEMVRQNEMILTDLVQHETGSSFISLSEKESPEFWIRLEGNQFKGGKGPIGIVGSFLQKLSTSTQHVVEMLDNKLSGPIQVGALFDLVQTASGSLKLGLKRSDPGVIDKSLFPSDPWERLKEYSNEREKLTRGINSLMEVIENVNNNKGLETLKSEAGGEIEAYKLLHYAKEITPSAKSPLTKISFESTRSEQISTVIADKKTRKAIINISKEIGQGIEYVQGNGVIRAVDMDKRTFIIRELKGKSFNRSELECHFPGMVSTREIEKYLDQLVNITGFLHNTMEGRAQKIDIEKLSILDQVED